MNLLERIQYQFALSAFRKKREAFYRDLAEAIDDGESVSTFLANTLDFCRRFKMVGRKMIYATMLRRMNDEEGRMSHFLKTIVPDSDLLALTTIDNLRGDEERANNLRVLADTIESQKAMGKVVRNALIPALSMSPAVVLFIYMTAVQVPIYEQVIPDLSKWPGIGLMLRAVANMIKFYALESSAILFLLGYGFWQSFHRWYGPSRVKYGSWGPYRLYRQAVSAKLFVSLASLLKGKKGLVESLEQLRKRASPYLRWHLTKILNNLNEHPDDYAAAFDTGLLSREIHLRLTTYARRSNFETGLIRIGTESYAHVIEDVRGTATQVAIWSTALTIGVIGFFYGGNVVMGDTMYRLQKAQSEQSE